MPKPLLNTGYRPPDIPDVRNFVLEKAQPIAPFPTSFKTDLTQLGVYHQHDISDCVENGITLVKRYHDFKNTNVVEDLSRRFLAALTVKKDGFPLTDGTSVENALGIAHNQGICESTYFVDDHTLDSATFSDYNLIPTQAYQNALTHTIASYAFVSDKSFVGIKNAIYQNGVVVLAVTLDKNWWTAPNGNPSWQASDILPLRIPTDKASWSGHVVVAYAYDENFIYIWNSFSDQWGYQGHGWFGPEYCKFIGEAATIVDLTADQIQKAKDATQIVNTIDTLKQVETPQNASLIASIVSTLWAKFLSLFS